MSLQKLRLQSTSSDDSAVWNKIKDRGDLAYFIQEGKFRTRKPEEEEKLKQEVEQIINQNPNSIIANQMTQSLEKFRDVEESRKAFRQKLRQAKEKNQ
jgi:DNA polymerase II large subunit